MRCRWEDFNPQDLLRVATGFAGLRLAPPSELWMTGLSAAARIAAGGHAEAATEAGGGMGGGGSSSSSSDVLLPAEDLERLQRAVYELDLLQQSTALVVG